MSEALRRSTRNIQLARATKGIARHMRTTLQHTAAHLRVSFTQLMVRIAADLKKACVMGYHLLDNTNVLFVKVEHKTRPNARCAGGWRVGRVWRRRGLIGSRGSLVSYMKAGTLAASVASRQPRMCSARAAGHGVRRRSISAQGRSPTVYRSCRRRRRGRSARLGCGRPRCYPRTRPARPVQGENASATRAGDSRRGNVHCRCWQCLPAEAREPNAP